MTQMTTKQRFLVAINGQKPDRLPVTTHHIMDYFLDKYVDDADIDAHLSGADDRTHNTDHNLWFGPNDQ